MVTKGEIQSIDQLGMTCEVRIPFFETAGFFDKVVATATISNTPGSYNGYKEGDIVMVAFDDGEAAQPVVIGLMYKGVSEAAQEARGALSVESINVTKSATIPLNTKLVYERDGSVAQNGQTKYESIADIANKLGDLTAQQSNESVDIVNVTATTNMLKSEIESLPKGTDRQVYRSETPPSETNYTETNYQSWSSEEDYIGAYIKDGTEYAMVTADNCKDLGIQPGVTEAYTKQTLKEGDIWVYSGDTVLYEMLASYDHTTRATYLGEYVYMNNDETMPSDEDPIEVENWPGAEQLWKAKVNWSFVEVTLSNYQSILPSDDDLKTKRPSPFVEHVTKNKQYQWDGEKWVEATDDLLKDLYTSYSSSMTQTAKSIEAKVSKNDQNSGTTVDFGWNILMDDDSPENARQDKNADGKLKWWHAGDDDGVFNIFSKITTNDGTEEKTQDVNVLHANKNGIHINGNLSVSDADGNTVFEALPWGSPDHDDVVDSIETPITYDGNAKVNIAGFEATAKTLTNKDVGFYVGEEGLKIMNGDEANFSVLSDGATFTHSMHVDTEVSDANQVDSSFDGNVCSHNLKVDTVELATTDTGKDVYKDKDEHVYRVERIDASVDEDIYTDVILTISNKKRDGITDLARHHCALKDTTVAVAVKIALANVDINGKSNLQIVTCSLPATFNKIKYSATDRRDTSYMYSGSKRQNVKIRVTVNADNKLCYQNNPHYDTVTEEWVQDWGDEIAISSLSNVSCTEVKSLEVVDWSPKVNRFFTGDFFNSTGFVKDKNGCFTEGMIIDLFSLPWKRNDDYGRSTDYKYTWAERPILYDKSGRPYKILHKGDTAVITKEQLPGLNDFSFIGSVNVDFIKRYLHKNDMNNVVAENFNGTVSGGTFEDEYWKTHKNPFALDYSISIQDFGVKLTIPDAPFEFDDDSAFIRLRVDREPVNVSIDDGKISFSPQGIIVSALHKNIDDVDGVEDTTYVGDIATFFIYGNNLKLEYNESSNSYEYKTDVASSGAYLAEVTMSPNINPSLESVTSRAISTGTNDNMLSDDAMSSDNPSIINVNPVPGVSGDKHYA